ncbi:MAG: hypothetical protein B6U72_06305 [Candidatus Altiarchaeales archaeon ex4484_2]|nr:MAG: hypothetical protein B6U72_06305 [Candidatus Altiarchaeales archaeon ex4484_2]
MKLREILDNSFRLLRERPRIFIPNLISSLIYAVFELVLIYYALDLIYSISNFESVYSNILPIIGLFLFYPLIGAIDLLTYGMYPSMVSDYHANKKINLLRSLKDSLRSWRILLALGVIFLSFIVLLFVIVFFFFISSILSNEKMLIFLSLPIVLSLIVVLMMAVFFVVPAGVIEKKGVLSSFSSSFKLSFRYRWEVFALIVFFMALVLVAISLGSLVNVKGVEVGITLTAVLLFTLLRLIQSVLYTYISVVNPYFYLHRR